MSEKEIICLKTGLFNQDPILEVALGEHQEIDLNDLKEDQEWDDLIDAILDADLVISL